MEGRKGRITEWYVWEIKGWRSMQKWGERKRIRNEAGNIIFQNGKKAV
jgi:hypothetical protein